MAVPDGFIVERKNPAKVVAPKFVSAFSSTRLATSTRPSILHDTVPRISGVDRSKRATGPLAQKPSTLRVRKPPPPPEPPAASSSTRSGNPLSALRPVFVLPQRPAPAQKAVPLLDRVPPPLHATARPMKTIFTTSLARATDFRSAAGAAELLSIFLKEHGHGFVDPTERELQRGLEQSPEKMSKRKRGTRFAGGGLADRARTRFHQSKTALALWQSGIELKMRKGQATSPDMRLRVAEVVYAATSDDHQRPGHAPCLGLVRCRAVPERKDADGEVVVLLNFDGTDSAAPPFNKPGDLVGGGELHIWRPWQTVTLPSSELGDPLHNTPSDSAFVPPRTSSENTTVLFCTRFWIRRSRS